MNIVVTKCDEGNYFANLFNSNGSLMSRLPVTKEFAELSLVDQYTQLKETHPDIVKRIR